MFLRMVYDDKLAQAAYVIGCQRTGEAIVFDPERDIDRYEQVAAREGLRLIAAAETHIHADFLSGARELGEKGATVLLSDEGDADWKYQWLGQKSAGGNYQHRLLRDGDTFRIGSIDFRAIHTPGHTPEHLCYLVTDRGGGADQPMGLITGDFVFVGDLGRPDLLESAAGIAGTAEASARRMFRSVQRFLELPDYLQIWPAHGAGSACGKTLGAVPQSTVGYEKRFNPAIRAASGGEDAFVRYILEGQPEPPLYFARMKRENKMGPRVLGGVPRLKALGVDDLKRLDARKCALIDTRGWEVFRTGHVPGSLFHPLNDSFNTDAGSMVGESEDIYLIIESSRVDEAVRDLIHVGLDRIIGFFEPGVLKEFVARGGTLAVTQEMTPGQAAALKGSSGTFFLDVRRNSEFVEGHIPGASDIAHTRLAGRLEEVPRDKQIVVNCRSGGRSARAAALLEKHGYRVVNLAGGMMAWEESGAPVER